MKSGKFLFKNRKYVPIPFFIIAVAFASPREDLMIFGALLMFCGEITRLVAVSYLGLSSRSDEIETDRLITNGPYAYVRNPIYFGNLLLYMGASILSGALLPYVLYLTIIFFSIYYAIIVRYEESVLEQVFSEKYMSYMNNVPRFFPRLSAYPDKGNNQPNINEGLNAEKSTIMIIIAFVVLILISWYIKS